MLFEICSEKFISCGVVRPPIRFNDDLNVVQGTDAGSNSIGKSTFLLAIDFAFGGDDYAKQPTIQQEIGSHVVNFCFIFDNMKHFFSRSTEDPTHVSVCDENYVPVSELKITEYHARLFELYKITLNKISFRDIIGRYFRIYGRDNLNEKRPLDVVQKESPEKAVAALLKLHDHYAAIATQHENLGKKEEEKDALLKAQNFGFLTKITKTDFENNNKRVIEYQKELEAISEKGKIEFAGLASEIAEQASVLQAKLTALKRQRGRLWGQFHAVKDASEFKRPAAERDFQSLTRYFPDANVREFQEIEAFHSGLAEVLSGEFAAQQRNTLALITATEAEMAEVEKAIVELHLPQKMSRATLDAFAKLKAQIEALETQNALYLKKCEIEADFKLLKEQFEILSKAQLSAVENSINDKMRELNDYIYGGKKTAPRLNIIKLNNYGFLTPIDSGTGTNYKNLVVFDIAALELTQLPAIAHDTVMFKQIEIDPIEKIIELYIKSQKQVFIAFDRTVTYPPNAQTIIEDKTVLRLSSGGNELYGYAWDEKS